jgi:hypothetical protein
MRADLPAHLPRAPELAARMLREGASRDEILASVEISPSTLNKVRRDVTPNGGQKWLSRAVESVVSAIPAWVPPENRGPALIALDAKGLDPDAEERFKALMQGGEPPRMTTAEFERQRPAWHAWVYGAAKNPLFSRGVIKTKTRG